MIQEDTLEGVWKRRHKGEPVSVGDVAGDVVRSREPRHHDADDEKAGEADLIEVFRVQEQVGDAYELAKIPRDHRKQDDPTKHQHVVAPEIIQEELKGEGVEESVGDP